MEKTDVRNISRLVINRINEAVTCYNCEGDFIALFPTNETPLPEFERGKVYIVDSDEYQRAKASGRLTKALVRIANGSINGEIGRGGTKFSYLEFYEKEITTPGARVTITPCSLAAYDRNDPKCMCHQLLNA